MEEKLIYMYECNYPLNKISKDLNMTLKDTLLKLEVLTDKFYYKGAITFSQTHIREILIEYVDFKLSSKKIAEKYGHCTKTILKILHENNINLRPVGTKKIFESDVRVIIEMYNNYTPTKKIAKHFNVHSCTICRILKKNNVEIKVYKPTIESRASSRKYHFNTDYFSVLDSEDKAYFLGLFAADGYFKKKLDGTLIGIAINQKKSSALTLQQFLDYLDSDDSLRDVSYLYTYKGISRRLYSKTALFNSKKLAEDVRKQLQLPETAFYKTFDITYPEGSIPKDLERHFCRGIFDGDGTINYYPQQKLEKDMFVSFYGTKKLLEGIRKVICSNCDVNFISIKPKITEDSKPGHLFELSWSGRKQVICILDWMYNDATVYLNEKYQKYISIDRKKRIIDLESIFPPNELKYRREELGISQLSLARNILCSGAVINEFERKKRTKMSTNIARKLLDFFSIDYDEKIFYY